MAKLANLTAKNAYHWLHQKYKDGVSVLVN